MNRIDLLEAAVAHSYNAIVITDANLEDDGPHIEYCNPAFCEMTGYALAELIGRSPRILQGPDTDPQVLARLRACLRSNTPFQGSAINYRKDGTPYHVEWNISPVRGADGIVTHFVSVQQDISTRLEAERDRRLLANALNVANDPILITDRAARIVFVNQAFERLTGYDAAEALGQTPAILRSGEHDRGFYEGLWSALERGEGFRATFTNRRKNGELFHVEQSIAAVRDDQQRITHYVSIATDISEYVQRQRRLHELAHRDKLTGLLNRRAGEAELQLRYAEACVDGTVFALIIGDIDHFKQINDRHGHPVGDRVLVRTARLLSERFRRDDAVIRWGGEEFMVILPNTRIAVARQLADRIREGMRTLGDDDAGAVSMSLGVGQWQQDESIAGLIHRVDKALYSAKALGRNRVVVADGDDEDESRVRTDEA